MELNKDIFLKGQKLYLRILNENDISGNYSRWLNDPEITLHNSHGRFPMTIEKLHEFVKDAYYSTSSLVLAIVDRGTNQHIGNISLQNINWIDRNAEIAFLLGEREYWGKGVMYEAGSLMLQHGFKVLNLHRIYCGTTSTNAGMNKLAEKLGMTREGLRKDAVFKNGTYVDIVEYGIINPHEIL